MSKNKKPKAIISTELTPITLGQYIGGQIKKLRKENSIGQEDLANYIGIKRTSLSNIENGKYLISIDYVKMICDYFNVKSSELLPF